MFETLQFFRNTLGINELETIDVNECVSMYQNSTSNKVKGKCIALVYCKLFPMIIRIQQSFPMLTKEQKAEACLNILQCSMDRFNSTKKNIKFTSYFYGNFKRNLLTLKNTETNCHKRKVWSHMVDMADSTSREHFIASLAKLTFNHEAETNLFFHDLDVNSNLTTDEKTICRYLLQGYRTCKELAPFVFPNKPLTEENYSIINKMRANLKKKIKNNEYNVI